MAAQRRRTLVRSRSPRALPPCSTGRPPPPTPWRRAGPDDHRLAHRLRHVAEIFLVALAPEPEVEGPIARPAASRMVSRLSRIPGEHRASRAHRPGTRNGTDRPRAANTPPPAAGRRPTSPPSRPRNRPASPATGRAAARGPAAVEDVVPARTPILVPLQLDQRVQQFRIAQSPLDPHRAQLGLQAAARPFLVLEIFAPGLAPFGVPGRCALARHRRHQGLARPSPSAAGPTQAPTLKRGAFISRATVSRSVPRPDGR